MRYSARDANFASVQDTDIQTPVPTPATHKYLLVLPDGSVVPSEDRPKQTDIRDRGVGNYTLHRADGQTLKAFHVAMNRNGNLTITGTTPGHLEGLSTLNLERLVRYYDRIIKIWPDQQRQVTKVTAELAARAELAKKVTS